MATLEDSTSLPHRSKKQKEPNGKKRSRQDNSTEEQPKNKRPKKTQERNLNAGDTNGFDTNAAIKSKSKSKNVLDVTKATSPEVVGPTYNAATMDGTNSWEHTEDRIMEVGMRSSADSSSGTKSSKRKRRRNKESLSDAPVQPIPDLATLPSEGSLLGDYSYDPTALPFSDAPIDFSALQMGPNATSDDLMQAIGSMDLTSLSRATGREFVPNIAGPSNQRGTGQSTKKRKARVDDATVIYNPNDPQGFLRKWLSPAELKKAAEEHGLEYSKGKFTAAEKDTVQAWFDSFAAAHRLSDEQVIEIIFTPKGALMPAYKSFWLDLAAALPKRPVTAVFNYVRRAYNPLKGQGKWAEEEDDTLRNAIIEFGQLWTKVSGRVGRPPSDCRDRYRNHIVNADTRILGAWSKEEITQLTEIMAEFNYEKPKGEDNDTFWRGVSHRMGGARSAAQIRTKWQDSMSKTFKPDGQRRWSPVDSYILVHKVATMNVTDESEIDWKLLVDDGWNLWSPHVMQKHWFGMKRRVEGHEEMPFYELVEILMAKKGSLSQNEIEDALKKSQEERPVPRTPKGPTSKEYVDDSDEELE